MRGQRDPKLDEWIIQELKCAHDKEHADVEMHVATLKQNRYLSEADVYHETVRKETEILGRGLSMSEIKRRIKKRHNVDPSYCAVHGHVQKLHKNQKAIFVEERREGWVEVPQRRRTSHVAVKCFEDSPLMRFRRDAVLNETQGLRTEIRELHRINDDLKKQLGKGDSEKGDSFVENVKLRQQVQKLEKELASLSKENAILLVNLNKKQMVKPC